jgi:hypothetical protein
LLILEEKATAYTRVFDIADNPAQRDDLDLHSKFQGAFANLLDKLYQEEIPIEDIDETLFYCWVRSLTLMPEGSHAYFGKISRNWQDIFAYVSEEYVDYLMKIIYDARKEVIVGNS